MSLRQVLTIFKAERQLNDDEVAFLNTLRKMTGPELELLGVALAPQAKPKPRKKREAKSARASGMATQLDKSLESQRRPVDNSKCVYQADGKICLGLEGDAIHDESFGYAGYHEFQPPQQAAATGD